MLPTDTVLAGRYRITDVIARGGMGVVYRATDDRLRRPVAVKTVGRDDPQLMVRLRKEASLLARVSHPNVVRLYDVAEHDGQYCLISELVEGTPLGRLKGHLTTVQVAAIAEQIAAALGAAHARGIVHRDLKPSNVMVGDRVRLLDFGIARHTDDSTTSTTDGILGTAPYLAPEQLEGHVASHPVDIYALGLVLIELFTGEAAFAGTFAETLAARLKGPPEIPPSVPASWHPLIGDMVARDPGARPSATEVGERLRALRTNPDPGEQPPPGAAPTALGVRRPSDATTAGSTVAVAAAAAAPTGLARAGAGADAAYPNRAARRGSRARFAAPAAVAVALAIGGFSASTLMSRDQPQDPAIAALTGAVPAGASPVGVTTETTAPASPIVAVTDARGPERQQTAPAPAAYTPVPEAAPVDAPVGPSEPGEDDKGENDKKDDKGRNEKPATEATRPTVTKQAPTTAAPTTVASGGPDEGGTPTTTVAPARTLAPGIVLTVG